MRYRRNTMQCNGPCPSQLLSCQHGSMCIVVGLAMLQLVSSGACVNGAGSLHVATRPTNHSNKVTGNSTTTACHKAYALLISGSVVGSITLQKAVVCINSCDNPITILLLHLMQGLERYVRKKKMDPLDTYVPLVLEARERLAGLGSVMGKPVVVKTPACVSSLVIFPAVPHLLPVLQHQIRCRDPSNSSLAAIYVAAKQKYLPAQERVYRSCCHTCWPRGLLLLLLLYLCSHIPY